MILKEAILVFFGTAFTFNLIAHFCGFLKGYNVNLIVFVKNYPTAILVVASIWVLTVVCANISEYLMIKLRNKKRRNQS